MRPRVGQLAMCLCIHTDITLLLSPYIKERRSLTVYTQLSSYMQKLLHVSVIHIGVTEHNSGTTQLPMWTVLLLSSKMLTKCDNSGTLVSLNVRR